jgi:hypothetical protein
MIAACGVGQKPAVGDCQDRRIAWAEFRVDDPLVSPFVILSLKVDCRYSG